MVTNGHTVLIAGGSGLVGKHLSSLLSASGYTVRILTRGPSQPEKGWFHWDPARKEIDEKALENTSILINLAGAGIADKLWTPWRKRVLVNSRIFPTRFLNELTSQGRLKIHTAIHASAIGIYGNTGDQIIHEDHPEAGNFLAETCKRWEAESNKFEQHGVRNVILRIGNVLAHDGGIWPILYFPYRFGIAPVFGSGKQYFSWIHIDDLCCLISSSIVDSSYAGTYNAVAPGPITYSNVAELMKQLKKGFQIRIPIPSFLLAIALGGMSQLLTEGSRISPEKAEKNGFSFMFPTAGEAFRELLK